MTDYPQTAVIAVVDMEDSSSRTDMGKREARREMYDWLERTLGPVWSACDHEDRGDGVLMLWPQSMDGPVPPKVVTAALLGLPATASGTPERPRLRVALHIGPVFRDERGFVGRSLDRTFRLNEADVLRTALARARGPVAYLLSDVLHEAVIEYGYQEFDRSAFHPVTVVTRESTSSAWLHVPGEDGVAARLTARTPPGAERPAAEPPSTSSAYVRVDGDSNEINTAGGDMYR
ncbi:hypothetical protein [Actinomadura kijaniata]|uniref:hypothetical protein n=1 Tax=Actinomadura kijaniata TaxID=46161 RepID=UPI0008377BF8|nr:hypothetical protein [Actinomadura kijaniata]